MKQKKIIALFVVLAIAISFYWGENIFPGNLNADKKIEINTQTTESAKADEKTNSDGNAKNGESNNEPKQIIDPKTGKDQYQTDPVPEGKPLPVEPQNVVITDKKMKATLSISCSTLLDNLDEMDPEKIELVPKDGVILPPTTITFYEGESVFDVLKRETKNHKIHLEFENTPVYNSAYIQGINNLYEFDGGRLSGWMYKVNGWFPNYGCSRYQLKEGDIIEWVYTCDLGRDVGGYVDTGYE